jgi:hypothetical protein
MNTLKIALVAATLTVLAACSTAPTKAPAPPKPAGAKQAPDLTAEDVARIQKQLANRTR